MEAGLDDSPNTREGKIQEKKPNPLTVYEPIILSDIRESFNVELRSVRQELNRRGVERVIILYLMLKRAHITLG